MVITIFYGGDLDRVIWQNNEGFIFNPDETPCIVAAGYHTDFCCSY